LQAAFDQGINFYDTADSYGLGGSERVVGRTFATRRDQVIIASKCGYVFSSRLKAIQWIKPLVRPLVNRLKGVKASATKVMASQRCMNHEADYVEQCVHGSLTRLGTDYIDLFYLHDPPPGICRQPEVFERLNALVSQGKLRHVGVSCSLETAMALMDSDHADLAAVQITINMVNRDAVDRLLPAVSQAGMGLVARQPFARGDVFIPGEDPRETAKLAIRYVLDLEGVTAVLPSMMRPENLKANVEAADAPPLSDEDRSRIARIIDGIGAADAH
jgi:aryl-alcohol dehydrogenase-like predicted oxidoreductase